MRYRRKILLLEDDELFAESLEDFLSTCGYCIDIANDGEEAFERDYENVYNLYLLDINVPGINGLDFLKTLRQSEKNIPAIFITSYKDTQTLKKAFDCGCDDYMKKPCDLDELVCRIETLLKRVGRVQELNYFSEYTYYSFLERKIYHHGSVANLSYKVTLLIELFLENANQIVTKEMIINRLWSASQTPSENAIRAYITQIRQLVGKDKLISFKGVGYKLFYN